MVDRANGPDVGIAWLANGVIYPLRAPLTSGDSCRDVVAFEWSPTPPRLRQPTGFWDSVRNGIAWCLEQEGQSALLEAQGDRAIGQPASAAASYLWRTHPGDGLEVALDAIPVAVGLSLLFLPAEIGVLGMVALFAGCFLLVFDGAAYVDELTGDEAAAEHIKQVTEYPRMLATLLTLPDLGWNGALKIGEFREAQAMRVLDRQTARAAETIAARTRNAGRAARLQGVAEKANLRAQLRTEQIRALLRWEMAPRGAGLGSAMLLLREEYLSDESAMNRIGRWLQIHCLAVDR